jgi:hypothetical protein
MVDLQMHATQAHWNLVGRSFGSLHTHLNGIGALARDAAGTFAERVRAVGAYPDARVSVMASTSTLLPAPDAPRTSEQAARVVSTRLHLSPKPCLTRTPPPRHSTAQRQAWSTRRSLTWRSTRGYSRQKSSPRHERVLTSTPTKGR